MTVGLAGLTVAVLAALAAGVVVGLTLVRRRQPSQGVERVEELWDVLGKPLSQALEGVDEAWSAALAETERQREAARRAQRLQLATHTIDRERELLLEALDALSDGILVLEGGERVAFANRMARQVLGFGDRDGPSLEQANASFEIVDAIRSVLGADLARRVKRCKIRWSDHDDSERTFVVRGLESSSSAVAEELAAPATSRQLVALEDRTAEERNARAKSEFIYGVSHELKTPLTSIQASLEMLVEDDDLTPEERQKLATLSHAEAVRLTRMVHELLDLARVEAGITEFTFTTLEVGEMLRGLRDMHLPLADRASIALEWELSDYLPVVVGDARLLRQAFVNIIGNSVKYTKSGGRVRLSARPEGAELVVRVEDTGIGIAEEDLPRVFDKFFRAGSAERSRVQGTGLGLPMARYIIEKHQGRIEVRSEVGVGTEFAVFLPTGSVDPATGAESTLVAVDGGE
ncbi:MAG: HAMP domain-containing sensor histidine kinase [Planctomycetota bacterium]